MTNHQKILISSLEVITYKIKTRLTLKLGSVILVSITLKDKDKKLKSSNFATVLGVCINGSTFCEIIMHIIAINAYSYMAQLAVNVYASLFPDALRIIICINS